MYCFAFTVQFPAGRSQPPITDGHHTLTRVQSMSNGPPPPALPAKNIHTSNLSLQHKSSFPSSMSQNFHSQLNPNTNLTLNGSTGVDRAGSIASQPPMHLNYPPKPPQLLNSLQQSNPYPSNNGMGRGSMSHSDMSFAHSNQNRANSVGYPNNNPSGPSANFIGNRTPSHGPSSAFQQDMFGNNNNITQSQHSMHSSMRSNRDQFQGPPDRLPGQHVSYMRSVLPLNRLIIVFNFARSLV